MLFTVPPSSAVAVFSEDVGLSNQSVQVTSQDKGVGSLSALVKHLPEGTIRVTLSCNDKMIGFLDLQEQKHIISARILVSSGASCKTFVGSVNIALGRSMSLVPEERPTLYQVNFNMEKPPYSIKLP